MTKLNILRIDDTQSKVDNISDALKSIASDHDIDINIVTKGAINPALYHMYCEDHVPYDFIFLDKMLPVYENDRFCNPIDGSHRILREMLRNEDKTSVILCSSDCFISMDYDNIISIIHYDSSIYLKLLIEQIILK